MQKIELDNQDLSMIAKVKDELDGFKKPLAKISIRLEKLDEYKLQQEVRDLMANIMKQKNILDVIFQDPEETTHQKLMMNAIILSRLGSLKINNVLKSNKSDELTEIKNLLDGLEYTLKASIDLVDHEIRIPEKISRMYGNSETLDPYFFHKLIERLVCDINAIIDIDFIVSDPNPDGNVTEKRLASLQKYKEKLLEIKPIGVYKVEAIKPKDQSNESMEMTILYRTISKSMRKMVKNGLTDDDKTYFEFVISDYLELLSRKIADMMYRLPSPKVNENYKFIFKLGVLAGELGNLHLIFKKNEERCKEDFYLVVDKCKDPEGICDGITLICVFLKELIKDIGKPEYMNIMEKIYSYVCGAEFQRYLSGEIINPTLF